MARFSAFFMLFHLSLTFFSTEGSIVFSIVRTSLLCHFLSHGFQICIFCGIYQRLSACIVSVVLIVRVNFYREITKTQ